MPKASRVEWLLNQTVGELTIEDETGRPTTFTGECSLKMKTTEVHLSYKMKRNVLTLRKSFNMDWLYTKMTTKLLIPSNSLHPAIPQASADASSNVVALKHQPSSDEGSKVLDDVKEGCILEEARIIQLKRRRIAVLSCGTAPVEVREKCQWDFVLEEMAWLANDFEQERLWKMTAAAQICHRVALTSQLRLEKQIQHRKLKNIASILSNAILEFWSSVEVPGELEETKLGNNKLLEPCGY
ncbi:unnamed protein product [Brassica oleracea var. botrytis]